MCPGTEAAASTRRPCPRVALNTSLSNSCLSPRDPREIAPESDERPPPQRDRSSGPRCPSQSGGYFQHQSWKFWGSSLLNTQHFLTVPLPIRVKEMPPIPSLHPCLLCGQSPANGLPTPTGSGPSYLLPSSATTLLLTHSTLAPLTSQLCHHPRAFAHAVASHRMFPPSCAHGSPF